MAAFRSILVPLDGSTYSVQALALAEQFARKAGATVHLVLVHQRAPTWFNPPEVPVDMAAFDDAALQREVDYLAGVARRFAANSGLPVKHRVLDGDVPSAIEEFSMAQGVDLVVMTTHGHTGITRLWLGSTADKLIRRLRIPVLVVRPVQDAAIVPPRIRRILVPLDGSRLSASILDQAGALARSHAAELVLAMIVEPLPPMVPPVPYPLSLPPVSEEARILEDQRYLDAVRIRMEDEGLQVETRVLMGRKVAKQITEVAIRESCDLIAMATHGAGGLDRLLMGSVTDQVVRRASIPVLVLRPPTDVTTRDTQAGEAGEELVGAGSSCAIG
ncbi:MAG TPA: universal stress protein [Gemmatimonadales bacterium]|nr:universal stress protein [Gemmatimonadales bacterium]